MENLKKEAFFNDLEDFLITQKFELEDIFSSESIEFLKLLKKLDILLAPSSNNSSPSKENKILTENGEKILLFMNNNKGLYNNIFNSKQIGEGLFLSSRSVSGSMPKLIKNGFVIKVGGNPVCYSLTELGEKEANKNKD